jgi:hypothetical protein
MLEKESRDEREDIKACRVRSHVGGTRPVGGRAGRGGRFVPPGARELLLYERLLRIVLLQ